MHSETEAEAAVALNAIGTNALPWLTKWLLYEPSKLKLKMIELSERLPTRMRNVVLGNHSSYSRGELAIHGLMLLGRQARPAIPVLIRSLVVHGVGNDGWPITEVLASIGEESLPPLVAIMTNSANSPQLRAAAVFWIESMHITNSFVTSNLVACLHGAETEVARQAAYVLAGAQLEPEAVLPFLTNVVHHTNSNIRLTVIDSISQYGIAAHSALPTLLELLKDSDLRVRRAATDAVIKIDRSILPQ